MWGGIGRIDGAWPAPYQGAGARRDAERATLGRPFLFGSRRPLALRTRGAVGVRYTARVAATSVDWRDTGGELLPIDRARVEARGFVYHDNLQVISDITSLFPDNAVRRKSAANASPRYKSLMGVRNVWIDGAR